MVIGNVTEAILHCSIPSSKAKGITSIVVVTVALVVLATVNCGRFAVVLLVIQPINGKEKVQTVVPIIGAVDEGVIKLGS
jgi:hypothetical protein